MKIDIHGARVHNLKDVSVSIPKEKLTVVTGLSGSGKSSLAFDTLYAEGQRRYVESLSSYARQFLGRLEKPDVDRIDGLSPAVAIEQRSASGGPRSTVGTRTEVLDHLRMLYARIGETRSPVSGEVVRKDRVTDVVDAVLNSPDDRMMLVAPLHAREDRSAEDQLRVLQQQGYSRAWTDQGRCASKTSTPPTCWGWSSTASPLPRPRTTRDVWPTALKRPFSKEVADAKSGERAATVPRRVANSTTASNGTACSSLSRRQTCSTSTAQSAHAARAKATATCSASTPTRSSPTRPKAMYDGAVAPWRGERTGRWRDRLVMGAADADLPVHTPWHALTEEQQALVWNGCAHFKGIHAFFATLEAKSYKIQNRVMISRYRGRTLCSTCHGTRLGKDTHNVFVGDVTLPQLLAMPIEEALATLRGWTLSDSDAKVAERLLWEIDTRLQCLMDLGLGYLTLKRSSPTLSGGESQRIALSSCVGSTLVGSTYVLDEPSIGLHPEDTAQLIGVLQRLRNQGNTVVVVEHDDDIVTAADHVVDMGPHAGSFGGEVVFSGPHEGLSSLDADHPSLTAAYRNGHQAIAVPAQRRAVGDKLIVREARANNLQGFDATIPCAAWWR